MKNKLFFVGICLLFLTGCADLELKQNEINAIDVAKSDTSNQEVNTSQFTGSNFSVLPKSKRIRVDYSKKIDGDTARFELNGHEFKSRFLLIDTPETVKRGVDPQPFGKEASELTDKLLSKATTIEIEFDKGDKTDRYDRALCYVYVDNVLIQNILVSEGLARVAYISSPNDTKLAEIKGYEQIAKDENVGIWSIEGYVTNQSFNP
ncbi:thermonuclease family protein [Carnobacterium maltaromaticum]|uniref:thermonuclease family protein n=1 Tax=Carnobacterium maltaromaticum TaxID=2751 RepID=UPI00298B9DD0|nr:thermonuclease family protein [Carnobacterium maltaromaticum]MDW5525063.1 thermonuclease family protein [Carnobacterium maltaromaticum]